MKNIFFAFGAMIFSVGASAVVTKDCPQIIQLEISGYKSFGSELSSEVVVEGTLELVGVENSTCSYKNLQAEGDILAARIQGSLKKNAKEAAYIVMEYYLGEYTYFAYADVEAMEKEEFTLSKTASIYKPVENCYYGCVTEHKPVGFADLSFVADY